MTGRIFDIKRFAVHDGPGIRTTIFLKGCPLSCWWCHNPEGRSSAIHPARKQVQIGGTCVTEDESIGRDITVNKLMVEIEKDRIFFEESGGGVTFSGGEPFQQPGFLAEMLLNCGNAGIHTAVDTSGQVDGDILQAIIPMVDVLLYDIKLVDDVAHRKYTGISNRIILENLQNLVESDSRVMIRFPVIPGITDTDANLTGLEALLGTYAESIHELYLLPYHAFAQNKYSRLNIQNRMSGETTLPDRQLADLQRRFQALGLITSIGG